MKKLIPSLFLLAIIINSCSSPLSDLPISDPGLVTPYIQVIYSDGEFGVASKISTCLNDKNGAYIELMEGNVAVNGDQMEYSMTCYKRTKNIDELTDYTVTITLADSTEYPSKVKSPAFFKKVDYPGKIAPNESFDISWSSNLDQETQVKFDVLDTAGIWVTIFNESTNQNMITVDPDNYPKGDISEGMITISRTNNGELADGFNGGEIISICVFERKIKIKKSVQ
ncbi:MAG: hypothetical protein H6600_09060 [Flavobacteriales bacterium]|nr:hypothetical protein [Flavobacteriales bacterium]